MDITEPKVIFRETAFDTETTMAQCDTEGTAIYLHKEEQTEAPDFLFAIAHELRHIWQMRTNKDRYIENDLPANMCGSTDEYNQQLAEVDANAFASIVMIDWFGLSPQWDGMNGETIRMIEEKRGEILKELMRQ